MDILKHKGAMLNDLYQISMAYAYWKNDMANYEAVFNLFYRKAPFKGSYAVFSGLDQVINLVENFKFEDDDINWLKGLNGVDDKPLFEDGFLDYLKNLELDVDILGVEEGTVVFPNTPILRIQGPVIACQLLETPLLNIVNFDTLITTKAARVCAAAKSSPVFEFGLRRAQGVGAGLRASRSAWIAGCTGTSNILAAQKYGIPAKGTHAHSWVMSHDTELESFRNYGKALPNNCTLLVDTYGTEQGVENAIIAGKEIEEAGGKFTAIRLDSGDLLELSKMARKTLNKAGFKETKIVASNDLDEYAIEELKSKGARIDVYGVGTRLVTAFDQPALGGVYKISALRKSPSDEWQYKLKLSDEHIKVSNPGLQRVKRFTQNGFFEFDLIYDEQKGISDMAVNMRTGMTEYPEGEESEELLIDIFKNGKLIYEQPDLNTTREYCKSQLAKLSPRMKAIIFPDFYKVCLEDELYQIKRDLMQRK